MTQRIKVAISGSAGQIGYALLFRLASGQAFGPNVKLDLQLLEIEAALPALVGVVMELQDCAFPLVGNINVTSDPNVAFKDVNWVILVGAAPRRTGMERSDLLAKNGGIFIQQGKAINDNAADDVRVFVVGNPCNTNCLIAMNNAPDIPNDRFYAMTRLDQNRAAAQLAIKAGVNVDDVENLTVWGNHSATQYPDFYHATIHNQAVIDVIKDEDWLKNQFITTIQQRGAAVIKARGASSAASAANAALDSLYSLVHATPEQQSYSLCCCSQGEYDVDEGLIFSFPCRTENGRVVVIDDIRHNEFAQHKLQITLAELRSERDAIKALKLI